MIYTFILTLNETYFIITPTNNSAIIDQAFWSIIYKTLIYLLYKIDKMWHANCSNSTIHNDLYF